METGNAVDGGGKEKPERKSRQVEEEIHSIGRGRKGHTESTEARLREGGQGWR